MPAATGFERGRDLAIGTSAAAVIGLMAVFLPVGIVAFAGLLALLASSHFSRHVPGVVIGACSLYGGIYLTYRVSLGGVPVSALDAAPVCLLIAAFSLPDRGAPSRYRRWGFAAATLFVVGLATGLLVSLLQGSFGYQAGRVIRAEGLLVLALAASLVAGSSPTWRASVIRGLLVAAFVAAGLQIVSEIYQLGVGSPLWSRFPFGSNNVAGLSGLSAIGDIASTRDNLLATFIMLPAIGLLAYRLRGRDAVLLGFLVVGSISTLSRSMWLATIITLLTAWVVRRALGQRLSVASAAALAVTMIVVLVSVNTWAGSFIGARTSTSLSSSDISANYRSTETEQSLAALGDSPTAPLIGLGAGAFVPPIAQLRSDPTPILENEMLARLTNFGAASLIGTLLLLVAAPTAAFMGLRRRRDDDLMALALCFPGVLAISTISGVVLQLQITLPFWILAGTVLAATPAARLGSVRAAARARRDASFVPGGFAAMPPQGSASR